MDIVSGSYFSVIMGIFPFVFFFMWLGFKYLNPQRVMSTQVAESKITRNKKTIGLMLGGFISLLLILFVLVNQTLTLDPVEKQTAQPPVITPDKVVSSEPENAGQE